MVVPPQEVFEAVCAELRARTLSIERVGEEMKRRTLAWYHEHGYEVGDA